MVVSMERGRSAFFFLGAAAALDGGGGALDTESAGKMPCALCRGGAECDAAAEDAVVTDGVEFRLEAMAPWSTLLSG